MPQTQAELIRKRRRKRVTMESIRTALLRHIVAHEPTNWIDCQRATGVSLTKTREAGYWLAGSGLITWPIGIHSRITATDEGRRQANMGREYHRQGLVTAAVNANNRPTGGRDGLE